LFGSQTRQRQDTPGIKAYVGIGALKLGNDRMFTLRCRCGKVWYIDSSGERLNDEFQAHVNTHFQKGDWA